MRERRTDRSQIVLVTGAGFGIGSAIALSLARAGHQVYASMRDVRKKNLARSDALLLVADQENIHLNVLEPDVLSETGCRAAIEPFIGSYVAGKCR